MHPTSNGVYGHGQGYYGAPPPPQGSAPLPSWANTGSYPVPQPPYQTTHHGHPANVPLPDAHHQTGYGHLHRISSHSGAGNPHNPTSDFNSQNRSVYNDITSDVHQTGHNAITDMDKHLVITTDHDDERDVFELRPSYNPNSHDLTSSPTHEGVDVDQGSDAGSLGSSDRSMARSSASDEGGTKSGFFISFGDAETPAKQKPKLNSERKRIQDGKGMPSPRTKRKESARKSVVKEEVNGNNTQDVMTPGEALDTLTPPQQSRPPPVKYSPGTGMMIKLDTDSVSIPLVKTGIVHRIYKIYI